MNNMKTTITELISMIKAYYAIEGNNTGGNFHIVFDDGNTELKHVQWCLNECVRKQDYPGIAIGEKLMLMSSTQRRKLAAMSFY